MKIDVSFVLPAFKIKFLARAIDSILSQTYENFELIIVNDKSPDDIASLVNQYEDSRIKYYENTENIGGKDLVRNWNSCLAHAVGEWVIMASDDDRYDCDYLSKMKALIEKYESINLFHCRFQIIDENDNLIRISEPCLEFETAEEFVYHNMIKRRNQVLPNFVFRRSVLNNIGMFVNLPLAWGADDATTCRMALDNGVGYCNEILFAWRYSGENISSQKHNYLIKIKSRLLLKEYFENQILPFLKYDNIISKYYAEVLKFNFNNSIQGEISRDVIHARSFNLLFNVIGNKELRKLLGWKNIFIMGGYWVYFFLFKK